MISSLLKQLSIYKILSYKYGHLKSCHNKLCIDKNGNPIPWYTYPAIEYLKQLDMSDKIVYEYGLGYSTLFWGAIAKEVYSVEDNKGWFDHISQKINTNTKIKLANDKDSYSKSINEYDSNFDIIIIDGKHRLDCALESLSKLNEGGLIILDNSDRKECIEITELLRKNDFIQVDFHGFGPINGYTWTTSLFFHRKFNFKPLDIQPKSCMGSIKYE